MFELFTSLYITVYYALFTNKLLPNSHIINFESCHIEIHKWVLTVTILISLRNLKKALFFSEGLKNEVLLVQKVLQKVLKKF